jgi:hypothetical protein
MARRPRAAQTKSRLWEITLERSEKGTNSADVVRVFRERYPNVDGQEREDLISLGLMTLAGRVVVSTRPDDGQFDIFSQKGYPDFIPLRIKNGNKFEVVRRQGRQITPREYFANAADAENQRKSPTKPSKRQLFHARMEEMREKGLMDTTLSDYLDHGDED